MQLSSRAIVIVIDIAVEKDTYKSHGVTIQRLVVTFYQQLIPLFTVRHGSQRKSKRNWYSLKLLWANNEL